MADFKYTDNQNRSITQTAYDAQKAAGTDVSDYKPIEPVTAAPISTPTPAAPVAPVATQPQVMPEMPSTDSTMYKSWLDKGFTPEQITTAYDNLKKKQVQPQPVTTTATPQAQVEQTPAQPQKQTNLEQKQDKITPLAPLAMSEYQDNSTSRQNEIVNNLNQYRQSAPQYMGNIDTFRKTFSYGLRSPEQQALLNNWYTGYQKGVELNGKTTEDISNGYSAGTITDNDLENLKLNNPAKYTEIKTYLDKKKALDTYKWELYGDENKTTPPKVDTNVTPTASTFFDEYKKAIGSKEVQGLNTEIADLESQREDLNRQLLQIESDVRKQYEWTGATETKIAKIAADAQKSVTNKLNALGITQNNRVNKLNSLVNTAKDLYETNLKEQEYKNAEKDQKMQELGFYYQYDPKGIAEQAAAKYNAENPDMNSTDLNTQKQALNQTLDQYYKDYGAIIKRPKAQVIADVQAYAKSKGISVSQALKENFITPLQGKSEYKAMLNKAMGIEQNTWTTTIDENGNTKTTITWKWSPIDIPQTRQQTVKQYTNNLSSAVSTGNVQAVWQAVQNVANDWDKGGQCGVFANNISTAIGSNIHFGDTLESKKSQINSQTPEVGSFVVMTSKNQPWSWHVGMVTWINPDWTINIKSSNYKGDEKVRTDTIQAGSPSILWYAKPTINPSKSTKPLTDDQRVVFNNQLSSFRSNPVVKSFEDWMTQYSNIQSSLENVSWPGDVAAIFQFMKSLDPTSVVRESEFQVAAQSAWVAAYIGNTFNRLASGEKLTDEQRQAFGKLAKQFIINRGKSYDRLYDDMTRVTDNMWIDRTYIPTKATESLNTTPETTTANPYSYLSNNQWAGNVSSTDRVKNFTDNQQ